MYIVKFAFVFLLLVPFGVFSSETPPVFTDETIDEIEVQIEEPIAEPLFPRPVTAKVIDSLRKHVPRRIDYIFKKLKIPAPLAEDLVGELNHVLDDSSHIVSRSNAHGVSFRLITFAGIGMNSKFMKKRAVIFPHGHKLGFLLGAGASFVRVKDQGKNKIIIRLFFDYEKLSKVMSWLADTGFSVGVGKRSEIFNERAQLFEKALVTRTYFSSLGQTALENNSFEFEFSGGIAMAPVISTSYFYQTQVRQYRMNFMISMETIRRAATAVGQSCKRLFLRH